MGLKHSLLTCVICMAFVGPTSASTLAEGESALLAKSYQDALRILEPLANGGNHEAQRLIGEMCLQGQGMQADASAAFKWTELSAERGNRVAEYNMGYLHEHGLGTPRSMDLALKWYVRSANKQYSLAARRLGDFYASSDRSAAIRWYEQARLSGDEDARKKFAALTLLEVNESNERKARKEKEREEQAVAELARRAQEEANSPPVNYAAAIGAGVGSVLETHAAWTSVHNQAVVNTYAVIAERQRREQEQRNRDAAQMERQRQERREHERRAAAQRLQAQGESERVARAESDAAREREERAKLQRERQALEARPVVVAPLALAEPPKLVMNAPAPCVLDSTSARNMDKNQLGSGCLNDTSARPQNSTTAATRMAANNIAPGSPLTATGGTNSSDAPVGGAVSNPAKKPRPLFRNVPSEPPPGQVTEGLTKPSGDYRCADIEAYARQHAKVAARLFDRTLSAPPRSEQRCQARCDALAWREKVVDTFRYRGSWSCSNNSVGLWNSLDNASGYRSYNDGQNDDGCTCVTSQDSPISFSP